MAIFGFAIQQAGLDGFRVTARRLADAAENQLEPEFAQFANKAKKFTLEGVRSEAPRNTGAMAADLDVQLEKKSRFSYVLRVVSNKPYTKFVLEGTKAHVIVPVNVKALHWGQDSFARRVQHPGTKANPFYDRGMQKSLPQIRAELDDLKEKLFAK